MYNPVKRGVRPLYSVLLLAAMAATLIVRVLFHENSVLLMGYEASPVKGLRKPIFNETLLRYAAIDIAEPRLKQEIEDLLDGNFRPRNRQRSFLSFGKYNIDLRLRSARGTPLQLRSPEFRRLWSSVRKYLGDWYRKRRFRSDIMSGLADEVRSLIATPDRKNSSGGNYKSCAVVGNSGILLKSSHGREIDSHELVIRLNNARTKRFEAHVGSKTNLSFINSNILHLCARREGCFCHPYGDSIPIVMYICQPVHFLDYSVCKSSHKAPLIITDPRFDVLCSRIVKYYSLKRFTEKTGKNVGEWGPSHDGANFHYSSGMQAVMLALGICERVSLFGFGKAETSRHHYHTNQKAELPLHDYEAEYDFYHDLVERPMEIPFVSGKFEFPPVVMNH